MKTSLILSLCLLSLSSKVSHADISQAPPTFKYGSSQAVFVDFELAEYSITYDREKKTAIVQSKILFTQPSAGHMLFDLIPDVSEAKINGATVKVSEVSLPGDISEMKILESATEAGRHTLEVTSVLDELVSYEEKGVRSAFWTTDLSDRGYLEKYLPANLEFDQVPMILNVTFVGNQASQEIYTNGALEKLSDHSFKITYPTYFNTTSIFFHTAPAGAYEVERSSYTSIDGREIPIVSYSSKKASSTRGVTQAKELLKELEADYGAWPHASLVIYAAGSGGMEYSGATMTELQYLGHEMFHSYHARGLLPANGDSGWMDEAIAMWRDNGYRLRSSPGLLGSKLSNRSPYIRYTPTGAYSKGEHFMGYLASQTGTEANAFKGFLREYFQKYKYSTVTTQLFKTELEMHTGKRFDAEFLKYIFGGDTPTGSHLTDESLPENPVHRKVSIEELRKLL